MPELRAVVLNPPQPCGILNPQSGQICGQPATWATIEAAPRACAGAAGYLLVLPVCPACARGSGDTFARSALAPQHITVLTTTVQVPEGASPGAFLGAASFLDDQAARLQRDAGVLRERAFELARLS